MRKYVLIISICFCAVINSTAQNAWLVPQDQKEKLSTVEFTEAMEKSGSEVFNKNCISCHGTPGENNPLQMVPSPGDPAGEKYQSNTDGELFYKIAEGRVTMPSFKSALSKADIWNVIAYVRTFNPNYVQEVTEKIETNIPEGTELAMDINFNKDKNAIEVVLTGKLNDDVNPVGGVEVKLFAKKYFGKLPIGEAKATNKKGIATFSWNNEIPGDTLGNVNLIALFKDPDVYGNIKAEKTLPIGLENNHPPLNEKRAMWNVVQKAPFWVLIGYTGSVITVWAFIFYVLFAVKRIFSLGNEPINEEEKLI